MPSWDDAVLRAYLLGRLPQGDAEELEDAYFGDEVLLERLQGIEDDLFDDYLNGELEPLDKAAFERLRLASDRGHVRLRTARALRGLLDSTASRPRPARQALGPILALAATVLLSLSALDLRAPVDPAPLVAIATPQARSTPTPTPSAVQPRQPATFVIALGPLMTRGGGRSPSQSIPAQVDEVVLEFEGEPGSLAGSAPIEVSLSTVEGRLAWSGIAERAREPKRPQLLARTRLPARRLPPDDYVAALTSPGIEGQFRYSLRVVE